MFRTNSVNDLLSLKKEIVSVTFRTTQRKDANHHVPQAKNCIDSVVPIHCAQGLSVQEAADEAVAAIRVSKNRFDAAADSLLASAQREPVKYRKITEWIEGCQSFCMGNLAWR
jgi:hypothetical protein